MENEIPPLRSALQDALVELRDLPRGIYPPLLTDRGLAAALGAQAAKAAVRTVVEADGLDRHDQEVEAAVYFCALEALQNVSKYADAFLAAVHLAESDEWIVFDIEDDGRGFDPGVARGSGLQDGRSARCDRREPGDRKPAGSWHDRPGPGPSERPSSVEGSIHQKR